MTTISMTVKKKRFLFKNRNAKHSIVIQAHPDKMILNAVGEIEFFKL